MTHFQPRMYVLLLLLLFCGLLVPRATLAAPVSCTASMSGVTFGSIDFINGLVSTSNPTLSYICTNTSNQRRYVNVCFNINAGTQSSGIDPRNMTNGAGDSLQFQLYQNPGNPPSNPWGSVTQGGPDTPLEVTTSVPGNGNITGSATVYGYLFPGQTTPPAGSYQDAFTGSQTMISLKSSKNKMPASCGTASAGTFPFTVTATIIKSCKVTASPDLNLGSVAATTTNITGNNFINVACTNGTPYYVGLSPSNGGTGGVGLMKGTGSNVDKVPYQLRSTAGLGGTIWGNTATSTIVGNGVAGNGNGTTQPLTVYATVASANYTPDTYTDTVTINVNY